MKQQRNQTNNHAFDLDIDTFGSYQYTQNIYSARIATKKQSEEILTLLRTHFPGAIRILDIGCGDGTYTIELAKQLKPLSVTGFDISAHAIARARKNVPPGLSGKILFRTGDIYALDSLCRSREFDVAVMRGVLHHLSRPQLAIKKCSAVLGPIVILEPNGYNPILKLIEHYSYYHRTHGERSYWPPTLNSWIRDAGYCITQQKFSCITPYFCNTTLTKILKSVEPFFESLPLVHRFYCGANVILCEKRT